MLAEILILEDLQFDKVCYYTVRILDNELSEFEDFQVRMNSKAKDLRQLQELYRLIEIIGTTHGAHDDFFKREGNAERLPPPTYRFIDSDGETDFGLRLYCIKISEEIVILLNGDRKTAQQISQCPACKPHFDFANLISDAIYDARQRDEIEIDQKDILTEDGYVLHLKEKQTHQ